MHFTASKHQVVLLSFRCLFSADSVPPASLTLAEPTHPPTLSISLQPQSSSFPAASYGSQYLNSQLHSASSSSLLALDSLPASPSLSETAVWPRRTLT